MKWVKFIVNTYLANKTDSDSDEVKCYNMSFWSKAVHSPMNNIKGDPGNLVMMEILDGRILQPPLGDGDCQVQQRTLLDKDIY